MDFTRICQAAALTGLTLAAAACQQSGPQLEAAGAGAPADEAKSAPSGVRAAAPKIADDNLLTYIGEMFAEQQRVLAGKPPEKDSPSF
ncbi:hypothetical protein ASC78_02110 [Variovorax sp. Root318D1]|uniref:hypothetical protein n=1 Tax=Variovorax sp. Root318D1 TaxID=1736513 RepID=UPI0006F88226|nr:hypothetical protein [Variovorax sp. Root318D1]KQU91739.1 hypothetical protein ASC78_02110 [Variovorax sp. Root318D1]